MKDFVRKIGFFIALSLFLGFLYSSKNSPKELELTPAHPGFDMHTPVSGQQDESPILSNSFPEAQQEVVESVSLEQKRIINVLGSTKKRELEEKLCGFFGHIDPEVFPGQAEVSLLCFEGPPLNIRVIPLKGTEEKTYEMSDLPSGKYNLRLRGVSSRILASRAFSLSSGDFKQVSFSSKKNVSLQATIYFDGVPAQGYQVELAKRSNSRNFSIQRNPEKAETDGAGFIQIDGLRNGIYTLSAFPPDLMDGHQKKRMIYLHSMTPYLYSVDINEVDLNLEIFFDTYGTVSGRINAELPAEEQLIIYDTEQRISTRFAAIHGDLDESGTFIFTHVPPGTFNLNRTKPKGSYFQLKTFTLAHGIRELDLGWIDPKVDGHLTINLRTDDFEVGDVFVSLFDMQSEQTMVIMEGKYPCRLESIPRGTYKVSGHAMEAYRVRAIPETVTIVKDQDSEVLLDVEPVTWLKISLNREGVEFVSGQMIHESGEIDTMRAFPYDEWKALKSRGDLAFHLISITHASVHNMREGVWQVEMLLSDGSIESSQFDLEIGEMRNWMIR